jgi:purine-nucleoside phosphorylase
MPSYATFEDGFDAAAAFVRAQGVGDVDVAFVLGSGLGGLADEVEDATIIPYAEIPGFPHGNVTGHARRLVVGRLAGQRVLMFQGRSHYYESGDAAVMRVPLGLLTRLGSPTLILTNAAGSVRERMKPGDLVLISDHIAIAGPNPLIGDQDDHARFVPMGGAYDAGVRAALKRAADRAGQFLDEGIYMWFTGPSFESHAEIRMAQTLGADLVGMSTVPEVIMARRLGLTVAACSIVTNYGAGLFGAAPTHDQTKLFAEAAASRLKSVVRSFLKERGA